MPRRAHGWHPRRGPERPDQEGATCRKAAPSSTAQVSNMSRALRKQQHTAKRLPLPSGCVGLPLFQGFSWCVGNRWRDRHANGFDPEPLVCANDPYPGVRVSGLGGGHASCRGAFGSPPWRGQSVVCDRPWRAARGGTRNCGVVPRRRLPDLQQAGCDGDRCDGCDELLRSDPTRPRRGVTASPGRGPRSPSTPGRRRPPCAVIRTTMSCSPRLQLL